MRRFYFSVFLLSCLITVTSGQGVKDAKFFGQRQKLVGHWVLSSTMIDTQTIFASLSFRELRISLEEPKLTIEFIGNDGKPFTSVYYTDGRGEVNGSTAPNSKFQTETKTRWDKTELRITGSVIPITKNGRKAADKDKPLKIRYVISKDGKTLRIVHESATPSLFTNGPTSLVYSYRRKT